MQRTALCRSRRELFQIDPNSNECLLAKFGFDTAENEPCKVFRKYRIISIFRALGNLKSKFDISNFLFATQALIGSTRYDAVKNKDHVVRLTKSSTAVPASTHSAVKVHCSP